MKIKTINPATEEILKEYSFLAKSQVMPLVEKAHQRFLQWQHVPMEKREQCFLKLIQLLIQEKHDLAKIITKTMGKPFTYALAEIEKCEWICRHYAQEAKHYLSGRLIPTEMKITRVCYQPIGVIFAIMPWNFPFWQVFRAAVPTIIAGNTFLLKHAPNVVEVGCRIEALFLEAGFPPQVLQHIIIDNDVAADVVAHDRVAAVTLTGSKKAGSIVASNAARHLKKAVLELGGNDPYLVLEDADVELAAKAIVKSRLANCGQVCIAAKRVLAVASVHDALVEKIQQEMKAYQMGDPSLDDTRLGPMARADLRDTLHQQVSKSVGLGAQLLEGGEIPSLKGFYYPPTLLVKVHPGMPAFEEELFGPVISVIAVEDEAEAVRLANQSDYGLGAAIFTRDLKRGEYLAEVAIQTGSCFVNAVVSSDPRVPFGGIKQSGFGRELSKEGILEFVNTKTISINNEDL
ncbi:MAG: NAD-dependent succinate-semialdehyde dehydrogenase [Legionella sp.]|nr:NAD-dependent succinate-semialdehyde dehydrogenase [Legionella sp.]